MNFKPLITESEKRLVRKPIHTENLNRNKHFLKLNCKLKIFKIFQKKRNKV